MQKLLAGPSPLDLNRTTVCDSQSSKVRASWWWMSLRAQRGRVTGRWESFFRTLQRKRDFGEFGRWVLVPSLVFLW